MSTFAERLKDAMMQAGMKQIEVIRAAQPLCEEQGVKLGKSHMSQYLSGKTAPRGEVMRILAQVLEVDVAWLQGGQDKAAVQKVQNNRTQGNESREEKEAVQEEKIMTDHLGRRVFTKSRKLDNVLYDVRGPVVDEAARMEEAGMHILKLNIGNPAPFGFRTPDEVIYDMRQQLPDCEGYSVSKGMYSARKAIMQYAQIKGLPNVTINDIYTGNGASELISLSMQALLNNGDEILIPSPDYPLWTASATLAGGKVVHYICDEQAEWYPDMDDIRSKSSD